METAHHIPGAGHVCSTPALSFLASSSSKFLESWRVGARVGVGGVTQMAHVHKDDIGKLDTLRLATPPPPPRPDLFLAPLGGKGGKRTSAHE